MKIVKSDHPLYQISVAILAELESSEMNWDCRLWKDHQSLTDEIQETGESKFLEGHTTSATLIYSKDDCSTEMFSIVRESESMTI